MFGSYPQHCGGNIFSLYLSAMREKSNKKGINEKMTIEELAIMVNNGFTEMMALFLTQKEETKKGFDSIRVDVEKRFHNSEVIMNKRFDTVNKRFDRIENRLDRIEDRLDNVESNMVNKFEFKTVAYRVDKLEERTA